MALNQSENIPWWCICFKSFWVFFSFFFFFSQKKLQVLWRDKVLTERFSVSKDVGKWVGFFTHVSERNSPCNMCSTEFRQEKDKQKENLQMLKQFILFSAMQPSTNVWTTAELERLKGKQEQNWKQQAPSFHILHLVLWLDISGQPWLCQLRT